MRNSCKAFDEGELDEAIRIATCIRVLMHDTNTSTSLFKHLGATEINLVSVKPERPEPEPGTITFEGFAMGVIRIGRPNPGYGPISAKDVASIRRFLPLSDWWNEIIWRISIKDLITRKSLILTASNQDGGAHVDAELEESYKRLSEESFGTLTLNHQEMSILNMHLVAIRTVANEVLESPDLINLLEN